MAIQTMNIRVGPIDTDAIVDQLKRRHAEMVGFTEPRELVLTRGQAADLADQLAEAFNDTSPAARRETWRRLWGVEVGATNVKRHANAIDSVLDTAEHELRWTQRGLAEVTR